MRKQVKKLVSSRKIQQELAEFRKENKLLLQQVETLERQLEFKRSIAVEPSTISTKPSGITSESTAFALLSDIHFEETVLPETVLGLNAYNPKIARQRLQQFFYRVAKLLKKEQQQTTIDTLVLGILGDLITNYIHEVTIEVNDMPPAEAINAVLNEISGGIRYLLKNTDTKLDVVCMSGNHGRLQQKLHISREAGNSLEYVAYNFLARTFARQKRVKFYIPQSYLFYYECRDFTVAFHHGHFVRYNGGVGGITIPMNKAIAQWQKIRHADLYCSGHHHSFLDGGNFIINGSVIGYNAYALSIKANYEPAKQTFFLVNHRYNCKTITTPILFDV